jgi:hypothetical protein
MTIEQQLHKSATHREGFDPNCPKCLKDESTTGIINHLTACAVENELEAKQARAFEGGRLTSGSTAAAVAAEQRRMIGILKLYRMHVK